MKNITQYIFEKIEVGTLTVRDKTISELFNKDVHPSVSVVDLKDGDKGYFLRISLEDATVLDQWTCPCTFYKESCYHDVDGGLGRSIGVKWMLADCNDSESIKKYDNYEILTRITALDLRDNKQKEGVDITAWVATSSSRWYGKDWDHEWILVLIPNKENVDKFKTWIKEANDGILDKLANEYIKKMEHEKQTRIEQEAKRKEEAVKLKKEQEERLKNMGPLKPIKKSLARLYDEVNIESKHTCSGFDEISKELKKHDIKLSKTYFDGIFGKYVDCDFVSCTLSNNGYEGDVETAFNKTWGPEGASSYMDVLPEYLEINEGDGVAWGIDKNGIFIAVFEYDPCLVLMAKTK